MMVTVIGRGHGGTRAISRTLSESGVYMGEPLNKSDDLVPAEDMYEACRVLGKHVVHRGGLDWDFSQLHEMPIEPEFTRLVESYLASVLSSDSAKRGWKLPETTLVFPWITRMFPENYYIHWIRDPRDSILGSHLTDHLGNFGVSCDQTDDERRRRAESWKYQIELVKQTAKPKRWIEVRFEDFVMDQDKTLARLSEFLGFELAKIPVRPESVGRYKTDQGEHDFAFLHDDMRNYRYID